MRNPSLEIVKAQIIETQGAPITPLLLYRGALTPGMARAKLNFTLALMEANATTLEAAEQITKSRDLSHLCGLHIQNNAKAIEAFLARLWQTPETLDAIPHLREFLLSFAFFPSPMVRIAAVSEVSKVWWRQPTYPAKRFTAPPLPEERIAKRTRIKHDLDPVADFYPFITTEPTKEHDLLLAVDGLVPKGLPQMIREDLCQDLLVDVISGETTLDNLRDNIRFRVQHAFKVHGWKYGELSLDRPLTPDGRTLKDIISA